MTSSSQCKQLKALERSVIRACCWLISLSIMEYTEKHCKMWENIRTVN